LAFAVFATLTPHRQPLAQKLAAPFFGLPTHRPYSGGKLTISKKIKKKFHSTKKTKKFKKNSVPLQLNL